jgi:hypothetical protein
MMAAKALRVAAGRLVVLADRAPRREAAAAAGNRPRGRRLMCGAAASQPDRRCLISGLARQGDGAGAPGGPSEAEPGAGSAGLGAA